MASGFSPALTQYSSMFTKWLCEWERIFRRNILDLIYEHSSRTSAVLCRVGNTPYFTLNKHEMCFICRRKCTFTGELLDVSFRIPDKDLKYCNIMYLSLHITFKTPLVENAVSFNVFFFKDTFNSPINAVFLCKSNWNFCFMQYALSES